MTVRGSSYQTAPLEQYSPEFRELAAQLFALVGGRVRQTQAKKYKGSYTFTAISTQGTAAKIIIYEEGQGKVNGRRPGLEDGVYVLLRVNTPAAPQIWQQLSLEYPAIFQKMRIEDTLAIAPTHSEQFAFLLVRDDDEFQKIADVVSRWCQSM
jgi:hypothetical protein